MTAHPKETGELGINQNLPILHAYIHVLKHMEHIGYTFNARWAFEDPENPKQGMGSRKDEVEKWAVKESKNEYRTNALDKNGVNLALDSTFTEFDTTNIFFQIVC